MTPYALNVNNFGYALDSYVADIWDAYTTQIPTLASPPASVHGYYADAQSQGNVFKPFAAFGAWRQQPRTTMIYSVWRLDGASLALAEGLVDKAIAAEQLAGQGQLTGIGCFDEQLDTSTPGVYDSGYEAADWSLHRAAQFASSAGFTVIEDTNNAEFGTSPAGRCDGALLYSGWYSLNHYNDAFTWNTGAIGFHLDSNSASNPRGGTNWSANAIQRGITVTSGSFGEPYLDGLARPGGVYRNLLEGANVGDAFLRNTRWLKWQIMYLGDPLYTPFPGGKAPFNPPGPVTSFLVNPPAVVGGIGNATGTITLAAPAPSPNGLTLNLSVIYPAVSVPSSITIPAGMTQASFTITSLNQTGGTPSILTASFDPGSGPQSISNTVSVSPVLAGLALNQNTVTGGQPVQGQIVLNDRAPASGITVSVSSSNPAAASVPATVTVTAGHTSATFNISTNHVASSTAVMIGIAYGGVDQTNCATCAASLTVQ